MTGRDDGGEEGEEPARINLDYYFSTRRRGRTPSWPYLVSMVLMLATLIMLIVYQDRCGMLASQILFGDGGGGGP